MNESINKVKILVQNAKFEEAFNITSKLLQENIGSANQIKEINLLNLELKQVKSEYIKGTIPFEEKKINFQRIGDRFLELLNTIPTDSFSKRLNEYKLLKEKVLLKINSFDKNIRKSNITEHIKKSIQQSRYTIAIIGKVKAGKSTFINAFLGDDYLPTDMLQNTSVPIEIVYGPKEKLSIYEKHNDNPTEYYGKLEIKTKLKSFASLEKSGFDRKLPISYVKHFVDNNVELSKNETSSKLFQVLKEEFSHVDQLQSKLLNMVQSFKNAPDRL